MRSTRAVCRSPVSHKPNRFWVVILGGIILISIAAAILLRQTPMTKALVIQDGATIETLDLSAVNEPYAIIVENGEELNIISVERGRIRVTEANCPCGSCVRQGWISDGYLPIVCLPHRLVIKLEGGEAGGIELDAVVG